jgi:hypothetical protein
MSAAVCTRESAHIHWHLRVKPGGCKRVQPVLQPFRSKVDNSPTGRSRSRRQASTCLRGTDASFSAESNSTTTQVNGNWSLSTASIPQHLRIFSFTYQIGPPGLHTPPPSAPSYNKTIGAHPAPVYNTLTGVVEGV